MDLNQHKGKLMAAGAAGLLLIGVLLGTVLGGREMPAQTPVSTVNEAMPAPEPDPAALAAQALANCDTIASDPSDPSRSAAPVPDDGFAPGSAIPACEEAVRLNPENARAHFQLGRSYWVARRDADAFASFVESADRNYAAAMKYIGDAFYLNRGLPPGQEPNAQTALDWYRRASDGGYTAALDSIAVAEEAIRKNTFNGSNFQNANYMRLLYEGRLQDVDSPVALAYYVQGLVQRLDDENTIFMDEKCKPLLNIVGNTVIDNAQVIALAKVIADSRTSQDGSPAIIAGISYLLGDMFKDQGNRDGVVLFNREVYGCDSSVTKQIVGNIMVSVRNAET